MAGRAYVGMHALYRCAYLCIYQNIGSASLLVEPGAWAMLICTVSTNQDLVTGDFSPQQTPNSMMAYDEQSLFLKDRFI